MLNVLYAEKMMADVAMYVSGNTYSNFNDVLGKLHVQNLKWFKEYEALVQTHKYLLQNVQSSWKALGMTESACFLHRVFSTCPCP